MFFNRFLFKTLVKITVRFKVAYHLLRARHLHADFSVPKLARIDFLRTTFAHPTLA
jgi:hypothetical protein